MNRFLLAVILGTSGCAPAMAQRDPTTRPYVVGHLDAKAIKESSGVVESRRYPGVYWTHNDSGNAPVVYAVRRDGSLINAFPVKCVMIDWEDIAIDDEGHLYLADTGNNLLLRRGVGVLQLDEPDPNVAPDAKRPLVPTAQWSVGFGNERPMDCESLFFWKGSGYVIRKSSDRAPTTLWRFELARQDSQALERVATLPINAACTGADLSPDGDALAVMTDDGPFLFRGIGGDMKRLETLTPASIRIPRRTNEAVCFTKDGLIGTSEGRDVYFFPFDAFAPATTKPVR